MTIDHLKTLLAPDLAEVDRALRAALASDVALVRQVAEYIIDGGGKRLRPALAAADGAGLRLRGRGPSTRWPPWSR